MSLDFKPGNPSSTPRGGGGVTIAIFLGFFFKMKQKKIDFARFEVYFFWNEMNYEIESNSFLPSVDLFSESGPLIPSIEAARAGVCTGVCNGVCAGVSFGCCL